MGQIHANGRLPKALRNQLHLYKSQEDTRSLFTSSERQPQFGERHGFLNGVLGDVAVLGRVLFQGTQQFERLGRLGWTGAPCVWLPYWIERGTLLTKDGLVITKFPHPRQTPFLHYPLIPRDHNTPPHGHGPPWPIHVL